MSWHGNIKAEKLHEQNLKSMSGGFFVQADQYQGFSQSYRDQVLQTLTLYCGTHI